MCVVEKNKFNTPVNYNSMKNEIYKNLCHYKEMLKIKIGK